MLCLHNCREHFLEGAPVDSFVCIFDHNVCVCICDVHICMSHTYILRTVCVCVCVCVCVHLCIYASMYLCMSLSLLLAKYI